MAAENTRAAIGHLLLNTKIKTPRAMLVGAGDGLELAYLIYSFLCKDNILEKRRYL